MKKTKILFFVDRMRTGGIQILLVNLVKAFDREKYSFDVLLLDDGTEYPMEKDIVEAGAKLYKLDGIWLNVPTDYLRYRKSIDRFFKQHHDYDVVHMHSSSKNYFVLKYAKKYGIPIRIAHSHNTDFQTHNMAKVFVGNALKSKLIEYSTDYLACSRIAGEWLFGKRMVDAGKVQIIKNGVDLDRYKYDSKVRENKRNELGLNDRVVIGNVGRFVPQKNHSLLLDIFAEIRRMEPRAVLILAGIGELMDTMKEKSKILGIENDVKFLGFRTDVNELTQAMDLFLMPSLYEGFPVTAVEAQASGLPCVLSGTITREAALLDETVYIDLNESVRGWAKQALNCIGKSKREESSAILKDKGFDINDMSESLACIYSRKD